MVAITEKKLQKIFSKYKDSTVTLLGSFDKRHLHTLYIGNTYDLNPFILSAILEELVLCYEGINKNKHFIANAYWYEVDVLQIVLTY